MDVDYVSQNKVIDAFYGDMRLNPGANGEEHRLFGGILRLVLTSIKDRNEYPYIFGDFCFGKRFSGAAPYLARERRDIPCFPDCLFVNEDYVLCIDHFQINASNPRSDYANGDDYRAFLAKHIDLLGRNEFKEIELLLANEGIGFFAPNLARAMLYNLNSKLPKIPSYKDAACKYIASGNDRIAIEEDLAKSMEVWFLVEDVTPKTSFESLFQNEQVISSIEGCEDLAGLIYVHNPRLNQLPESVGEIAFIHNDCRAWAELRALF